MKFLKPKKLVSIFIIIVFILVVLPTIIFLYLGLGLYFKKPQAGINSSFNIEVKTVKIDGLEVTYKTAGEASKPPLVYIHGTGGTHEFVESIESPLIVELAKDFYVYAPQLPGQHRSEVPTQDISPEYYAEFVQKFITQVNIKKPILVGQSYGGRVATLYATKYQDTLSLLVIGDSSGAVKQKTVAQQLAPMTNSLISFVFTNSLVPQKVKYFFARYWFSIPEDKIDSADYQKYQVMRGLFNATDFSDQLKKVKARTLIIWGKNDRQFPVKQGEKLQESLSNSRLEVFDAGHTAMATYPEKTKDLILEEWTRLEK